MIHWFNRYHRAFRLYPVALITLLFCHPLFADNKQIIKDIDILEKDFLKLSADFYQESSNYSDARLETITNIDQLHKKVNLLIEDKYPIVAIQLLYLNIKTVLNNLDHRAVFTFTELLLENNEWSLANKLYQDIKQEGDRLILATIEFTLAKYHATRKEWAQVNKLLDDNISKLSPDDAAYAYLLNGSALQHLKKHREAIELYNKIDVDSRYYPYVQLNIAIANIRQGWWTDARTTINNLINKTAKGNSDELTNRFYLVLGYALLQKELYRDARDAFRHIGLDSRYTNRALLGIGLTATSQGDYIGGLNALTILKDKKTSDLFVDESYLLIPYVYEKLQQEITVTASYTEAMKYYQRRMAQLENIKNKHTEFTTLEYDENTFSIIIQGNSLNYGQQYPESFINNYRQLIEYMRVNKDPSTFKRIEKLIAKYDKLFQRIIDALIDQRKEYLKSYLNQSRYGLARLYDSANEGAN